MTRTACALLLLFAFAPSGASGQEDAIRVGARLVETKSDGRCYPGAADSDREHRLVECGNGTLLDTATGSVWLLETNCLGPANWWDAHKAAGELQDGMCGLTDGSQPGDWCLPTARELEMLVGFARDVLGCTGSSPCDSNPGNAPSLTNNPGGACMATGPTSWIGLDAMTVLWTAQTDETAPTRAIAYELCEGQPGGVEKSKEGVWITIRGSGLCPG